MRNLFIFLLIFIFCIFTTNTYAKSTNKVELLIDGCTELVGIYKNKREKNLLAGHTTSLSEAIKAGYCRGAIAQFIESNNRYCSSDWYKIAEVISNLNKKKSLHSSQSNLIKKSCHG
jgi:hypothetical protein